MNSKSYDDEPSSTAAKRVSARARYSQPPTAAFDLQRSTSTSSSASKSKGGINGRSYEGGDDDASEMSGISSRSAERRAAAAAAKQRSVTKDRGLGGPPDLTRQSSSTSKDRPWRTANSTSSATSTTASSYATASNFDSTEYEVSTPTSNRWTESNNYEEESRQATSKAVNKMATRMADSMQANDNGVVSVDDIMNDLESPMGGTPGSGYGDDREYDREYGEMARLELDGNSLPPSMDRRGTASKSTTDYVKSRLSSLLSNPHREEEMQFSSSRNSSSPQAEHEKVRNEALKMLQIADSCLMESPRNSAPSSPRNAGATGLFRTAGGGLAMRELDNDEVGKISIKQKTNKKGSPSSISGIENFPSERTSSSSRSSRYDGTFTIGSHDEDNNTKRNSNGSPLSPNEDTPSMWSSRYSVERQLMAITGGLNSKQMLHKMDILNSSRQKTKSARGLYRASGYAMDGSHEDYNDYNNGSSTGVGLGGIWLWLKGTLWSDDLELNYDGTTQSLVRREKAMRRRKRMRYGLLFVVGLSIMVGVLTHMGNPRPRKSKNGEVNFYVLSDEPYDFSNTELLTRELEALPSDAEFIVHLGNANSDIQSRCKEYGFERAAAVLKESPVPVLVIPGDLDWAACGSKDAARDALYWWGVNLGKMEKDWKNSPLDVEHSEDVVGNFSFLHKGVLFISVNMVESETEPKETTFRLEQNVMWTKDKLDQYDDDEYHAVVIFGHAAPSEDNGEYFWPLTEKISALEKPVLYLHANSNGSFDEYTPFEEAENLKAVQLERRGVEGPMKVVVKNKGDAFSFKRRSPAKAKNL